MKKSTIIASALALVIAGAAYAGKPVNMATGGGTADWAERVTYGFTAQLDDEGMAKGQFQIHHRDSGFSTHGYVDCLSVLGNVAWIGGVVTKSDGWPEVDDTFLIQVIDNGEGDADPIDQITNANYNVFESGACLRQPPALILVDFTNGNVQVK